MKDPLPCPECRVGKHGNCAEFSIDERDEIVGCPCQDRGHV